MLRAWSAQNVGPVAMLFAGSRGNGSGWRSWQHWTGSAGSSDQVDTSTDFAPLSATDITAFEAVTGPLPQEYRTWMQLVGPGAGPYYGFSKPSEVLDELEEMVGRCTGERRATT